MANLFNKAKSSETKKKSSSHESVEVTGINESLRRINQLATQLAEMEAEKKVLEGIVRETSKEAMINYYNENEKFPGSLRVVDEDMELLFITQDRYINLDEDQSKVLREKYCNELVEENTTYSFNSELVEKYGEVLSNLIIGSKKIEEKDKAKLIEASTKYSIKKGTIGILKSPTFVKFNTAELIEDIRPVFNIKSIKQNECTTSVSTVEESKPLQKNMFNKS